MPGLRFDVPVGPGGYAWWYVDALSDDGAHAITLIAFVGSVFSPWYFRARRNGRRPADPENHCALNVALYSRGQSRWTMTERPRGRVARDASTFTIGPSAVTWDGTCLRFSIAETASPIPRKVRGEVRLTPGPMTREIFALDPAGAHRWWPISPASRIEVNMDQPGPRWTGAAYLDSNWGSRAFEADFSRWDWSCARMEDGAALLYETWRRDGGTDCLALRIDDTGGIEHFSPPPRADLPPTLWRLPRLTRAETVRGVRTLDDTPFYARSVLTASLLGRDVTAMHETLSLDRFRTPWMQAMLPFRMRRW